MKILFSLVGQSGQWRKTSSLLKQAKLLSTIKMLTLYSIYPPILKSKTSWLFRCMSVNQQVAALLFLTAASASTYWISRVALL